MLPYLFISAAKFSSEADKKTHNIYVAHVRRPMNSAAIFLVECVYCGTFLQQQLCHLHTQALVCHAGVMVRVGLMIKRSLDSTLSNFHALTLGKLFVNTT